MLPSSLTVGCADCVHKYLALILMWYFRKRIKVIVIVIVQHHKAVVFFKLAFQRWQVSYLLAGGGDYLHIWVTLPDMLLQQGRKDYCLVHAVVGDIQHTAAGVSTVHAIYAMKIPCFLIFYPLTQRRIYYIIYTQEIISVYICTIERMVI